MEDEMGIGVSGD